MHRVVSDKYEQNYCYLFCFFRFLFCCGGKDFEMHSVVLHYLLSARKAIFFHISSGYNSVEMNTKIWPQVSLLRVSVSSDGPSSYSLTEG